MKERITLQQLIAYNNTPKAKALIVKYGYKPAKSYNDLEYKLYRFTKDFKQEALKELANIHPHKDLILNFECKQEKVDQPEVITSNDVKSNFEGDWGNECQCANCKRERFMQSQKFLNFEGDKQQTQPTLATMFPLVAISGMVAIAFYIAFSKR